MEYAENGPLTHEEGARSKAKHATKDHTERIRIEQHSATGLLWFAGWLFSIGLLHLSFWKGVLALLVWPYYIGVAVASSLAR